MKGMFTKDELDVLNDPKIPQKDYIDTFTFTIRYLKEHRGAKPYITTKLPLLKRIYKRLFPVRYQVRNYLRECNIRKFRRVMSKRMDEWIAHGDVIKNE